tara:strand:+ start:97 stop:1539 length:1443 start_codon:yes stop_codon:yes gene_type:complete
MLLTEELRIKFTLPNSIKEFEVPKDFHKNPNEEYDYDAYQYEFILIKDTITLSGINVPEGKWMKGAHLGVFDLSYWTSCENKEFREIFQGDDPCLKLRIYNTVKSDDAWNTVKQSEHTELTSLGAAKDPMSWNGNNGFPAFNRIRRELCTPIVKQLKNDVPFGDGDYDCGLEPISKHINMSSLQVRASWDGEFVSNITTAVDDEGGNTKNTDRVVVWEGRSPFGEDLRGDGNQTIAGVANTKSGKARTAQVKVARISYEINKNLTDLEIEHINNMLNKRTKKFYRPVDVSDGAKMILKLVKSGAKMKTPEHDLILKEDYGLNSKQRKSVYKEVVDIKFQKAEALANRTYADYTLPHLAPLKTKKINKLAEDKTRLVVPVTASVGFKWLDMIATSIRNAKLLDVNGVPVNKEYFDDKGEFKVKSVVMLLDYKQSESNRKDFRDNLWPDFKTKYNSLDSSIKLDDYEDMDLTVSSTTSKDAE